MTDQILCHEQQFPGMGAGETAIGASMRSMLL